MAVAPPPPPPQRSVRDGDYYDKLAEEMLTISKRLRDIAGEMKNLGELIDA